jgi:hypothetical protein
MEIQVIDSIKEGRIAEWQRVDFNLFTEGIPIHPKEATRAGRPVFRPRTSEA